MNKDEFIEVGSIIKCQGFKGELKISLLHSRINLQNEEPIFVEINQKLVPFFIEHFQIFASDFVVKLEDVNSVEKARELIELNVFLPKNNVEVIESVQFDFVVGYEVQDKKVGSLGKILEIEELPHQYLAKVIYKGKEILLPLNEEIILGINDEEKIISTELPDGLLDI